MSRLLASSLSAVIMLAVSAAPALAQADAQQAYQQAKAAHQAGKWAEARDLARKAAQTDPKNPEVFLLLGQAQYQLGELNEAVAAWQQTLKLAPDEPYAKRMVEVLQGRRADADSRIKFVEALLGQRLFTEASVEAEAILRDKALSPAQRAAALVLKAEALLELGKAPQALAEAKQVETLYPERAGDVGLALLIARAKVQMGDKWLAAGLAALKQIVAEQPKTPAAATAEYELLGFDLRERPGAASAEAMANWLAANAEHPQADRARWTLLDAYLALTRQGAKPAPGSDVAPTDAKALALAAEIYPREARAQKADDLTGKLVEHVKAHYAAAGAHGAAVKALNTLLGAPLPRTSRLTALKAVGFSKHQLAVEWLAREGRAGKLPVTAPRGQLPQPLADVVQLYGTIRGEHPADPLWTDQAQLAVQVKGFVVQVPAAVDFRGLKGPDAWALDIALPVVKANADAAAVTQASDVATTIAAEVPRAQAPGRALARAIHEEVVHALATTHPAWSSAMVLYEEFLVEDAAFVFQENIRTGKAEDNAKLSGPQKSALAALGSHLAVEKAHAPRALAQLGELAGPCVEQGLWAVAEEMYMALLPALPEAERLQGELAVVNLRIAQVERRDQSLAGAGLAVPRELDPVMQQALVRLYELQAGLDEKRPELGTVRAAWGRIVMHYVGLEYDEVARQAIETRPVADKEKEVAKPVPQAEEFAAFQMAKLRDEQARRELDRSLRQYGVAEKIALSPAFQEAIAAYAKFIAGRPQSPLAPRAVEAVFSIAQRFEQLKAFRVASGVYLDFAKFAAGVKTLSHAAPGAMSTADRASLAAADALGADARGALARLMAEKREGTPPPAKLSEEYAAALGAYKGLIEARPDGPVTGPAVGRVMNVALEYAKIDAWEVAEGVYADLLAAKLSLRRPERLQFARGVCKLGQVMPEHARSVLTTLSTGGLRERIGPVDPSGLAMVNLDELGLDRAPGSSGPMGPATATPPPPPAEKPPEKPALAQPAAEPRPEVDARLPAGDVASGEERRDAQLLAMIRQQEAGRAAQVAQLREGAFRHAVNQPQAAQQAEQQGQGQAQGQRQQGPAPPVLSEAEIARQEKALAAAYDIFQAIRAKHAQTITAEQARAEILVMVGHWRTVAQWPRAAALAERFLADNPTDVDLARLRLEIARDRLAWATKPIERQPSKQAMLAEVTRRFDEARKQLAAVIAGFPRPEEKPLRQEAQWDIAQSFLTQARVVDAFSPVLARGQYVRAAKELKRASDAYPDHPQIGRVPQVTWSISAELEGRGYWDEAILVWNDLAIHYPMDPLADQAAMKVAQAYHQQLKRPLKAAEVYQELNFARGGADQGIQNAIFQIGTELKDQKRWVEALHVLESFVDSFPRHEHAGRALTMIGQIHQANEAWEDALAAYRRVLADFSDGQWVEEAKWAIAECTINLSRWQEAAAAYQDYVGAYKQDEAKVKEAQRRMEVLKDLARYQALVDEKDQRKAFDAQFQIATIVRNQLANPVKAIIEYRKVAAGWPECHLADDALYEVGTTYLGIGETEKAREALLAAAQQYPTSPLADDALYMVGKSYEDESARLAAASREKALEWANEMAQRRAYQSSQARRGEQSESRSKRVADLKSAGKAGAAEVEEASQAANYAQFNVANVELFAQKAGQEVVALTATQLADRQDKINAALRKAVESYTSASKVAGADKAGDALLRVATIYDQQLKDDKAALATWLEIVRQFSGTAVAEDASWRIAQYYERERKYAEAVEAYKAFLRNYRASARAGQAQFAVAENYERLGQWVNAMDSYTNYINNFPEGPTVQKAREQINWIKTYRL